MKTKMKTIFGTILMAATVATGAAGEWDANLADFPRLAGETDDAPRFMRAVAAAPNGVLRVPKGEYDIATRISITNRCSLSMHPAAHLVARAKMDYVVFWDGAADYHALSVFNPDGSVYDNLNLFIKGGDIDGNGLASCLAIANAHHFTLAEIALHNGVKSGLCVTRETGGHLYELVANNVYCKCTKSGLAGNVGIDCQVADCHFTDCIVVDYTKGIRSAGGANRFTRCHVWGGTVPPKGMGLKEWSDAYARRKQLEATRKWTGEDARAHLALGVPEMLPGSVAFECIGGANVFDGCYADTAEIGYDVRNGAFIVNSGFYNNPRMNLRKSTAIVHRGGRLHVAFGRFSGAAGCEKLYEGIGKNVDWISNEVSGGAGMAAEAARLKAGLQSLAARCEPIKAVLDDYVSKGRIAGVVSGVSDPSGEVHFDCVGWADVENKVPIRTDTLFAIFSMTKTFNGVALMAAIDDGKMSLDDEVAKYLPEFADVKVEEKDASGKTVLVPPKRPLTIRDLVTHTSGASSVPTVKRSIPLREVARQVAAAPFKFHPGEKFSYGNGGVDTSAAALEVAVGMPFEDWLRKRVTGPLGMKDTTFTPSAEQVARLVKAYTSDDKPLRPASDSCARQLQFPWNEKVYPAASAGLFSTPADMIRFSQMLAGHGEWKGRRIVSRETFDKVFAVKQTPPNIPNQYCVGSWLYDDWLGHEGAMRTDQRANIKTGHCRLFFIQTENKAGSAFFALKKDWNAACDRVQGTPPFNPGN